MDRFFSEKIDRLTFLKKYNIPSNSKIILFAANGARLGSHEPAVLEHIRNQINSYNFPIFLIIRPHPKDALWEKRLSSVMTIKNEILMAADFGNIEVLGELLQFSDLLISTQGSISLDAIAMNLPVINLAFDTMQKSDSESVSRLYEMDHYADIAKSGAVLMANSFDDLDAKINQCLSSPNYNKEAVNLLRNSDIEPFDGRSSERLVAEIIST
jgi:CDP-glycerol glycerophosphotransferase (TagB/SpsB family)